MASNEYPESTPPSSDEHTEVCMYLAHCYLDLAIHELEGLMDGPVTPAAEPIEPVLRNMVKACNEVRYARGLGPPRFALHILRRAIWASAIEAGE